MKIFGFDVSKAKTNALEGSTTISNKRVSLADMVKKGGSIKISRDVFYELYIRNGDIRACIRDIAKRVGVNGLYLEKNGEVIEQDTKSIAQIFKFPTFLSFKVELFKHLIVGGECFIVPVQNGFGKVVGFKFLDPRTMVKFYDKTSGEITRFEQRVGGTTEKFSLDEISYYQFEINPNNNYEGLSIIEGIVYHALTDKEAVEKNFEFIEGGMMIDNVIMLDPDFDADELEISKGKLKTELEGKGRKTLITNTVKDVKQLSIAPKDLDWISQHKMTTDKVCAGIGVPKFLIGYGEGVQQSNGVTFYNQYIEGTIATNQELAEFIINELYKKFITPDLANKGIEIKLDGEKVDDRTVIETAQREDVKLGLSSIDEIRQERGKKPWAKAGLTDVALMVTNVGVLGEYTPTAQSTGK